MTSVCHSSGSPVSHLVITVTSLCNCVTPQLLALLPHPVTPFCSCHYQTTLCTVLAHCIEALGGLGELACKVILFLFNSFQGPHLQVKPRRNKLTTASANLCNF